MTAREQRHQRIRELLARNRIQSQQELHDLLWAEGVTTTQATLSRDLRDMGVTKAAEGYELPPTVAAPASGTRDLERAIRGAVVGIQQAGTLVVLRTHPGAGPALAQEIDSARLRHAAGLLAGADTIFVATHSVSQSGELVRIFRKLAGR